MKTIIIATDYSKGAHNALEYAAALARGTGSRLVIFNAFSLATPSSSVPSYVPYIDELIDENNERITKLGTTISQIWGIEVDCVTTTDLVYEGLRKQVRKQKAALVVMGMSGHSLVSRFFGSVTTSVIKKAGFPVLVVPLEARFRGLGKILFACNYQYLSNKSNLEPLCELAKAYQAEVEILHVEKDDILRLEEKQQLSRHAPNMEEVLKDIRHSYRFLYDNDVLTGIERGIGECRADLVAMVPHKQSFWESLFHPSLTRKMAFHSHVPILALPNINRPQARKKAPAPAKASH